MRTVLIGVGFALALAVTGFVSLKTAEARTSCSTHHGCVEGKYVRRPVAGMFCRSVIRKRPGYRTHFFCSVA